jgi:hypothetical protein
MPRQNLFLAGREASASKSHFLRHSGDNDELAAHIDACKAERPHPVSKGRGAAVARKRTGWAKLPPAQLESPSLEQCAASSLKPRDCFLSHPLLSDHEVSGIAHAGYRKWTTSQQTHVAALVAFVWIEASTQQQAIPDAEALKVHAGKLGLDGSPHQAVFAFFRDLWLLRRLSSASKHRPCGVPVVRVGTSKHVDHFKRNDVQHKRLDLEIDDGQVRLRQNLCRFFVKHLSASSQDFIRTANAILMVPEHISRAPGNDPSLNAKNIFVAHAQAALNTGYGRTLTSSAWISLTQNLRLVNPVLTVRLRDVDAATVVMEGDPPTLVGNRADNPLVRLRLATFDDIVLPDNDIPRCVRRLWAMLRTRPPAAAFDPVSQSEDLLRAVQTIPGAQGCGVVRFGLVSSGHRRTEIAVERICGTIAVVPVLHAFEYDDLDALRWKDIIPRSRCDVVPIDCTARVPAINREEMLGRLAALREAAGAATEFPVDPVTETMARLALRRHPDCEAKVGCGLDSIVAGWTRSRGRRNVVFSFVIKRVCGTTQPFSLEKCFESGYWTICKHRLLATCERWTT